MPAPGDRATLIAAAKRFLAEGRAGEASGRLHGLPDEGEVRELRARIRELALRKSLRQAKPAEFAAEAAGEVRLRLALARLGGIDALRAAAAEASLPEALRELAAWSVGDLRASLQVMRRRPGWQALAEGWMLILCGEPHRAREAFVRARSGDLRRAELGEGVAAALAGDLAGAEALLRGLGPFPQSAYPATSALIRILTRHGAGWDPAALRRLLREGTLAQVDRAVASCPGDRAEERGWLLLRRGDLRQAERVGDPRAEQDWLAAAGAWPALRADVLKRRFWAQHQRHEETAHLSTLHRELTGQDPSLAREAVLSIGAELRNGDLLAIDGPWQSCTTAPLALKLPAEWLWWWTRCMLFAAEGRAQGAGFSREMTRRNAGLAQPPRLWCEWKPVFARLETELPDQARSLRNLKLGVLAVCRERGERRKTIFATLLDEPERRDELLPAWCSEAAGDHRGKRQIAAELVRLHELFTGDLDLTLLHVAMQTPPPAELERLLAAMPADHAALVRWAVSPGPLPEGLAGRDERVDQRLLGFLARMPAKQAADLRKALWQRPEHFLRVLGRVAAERHLATYQAEALAWAEGRPRCWQAHYASGRVGEVRHDVDLAEAMHQAEHWGRALQLDVPDGPERQAMERFFDANPAMRTLTEDEDDVVPPGMEEIERVLARLLGGGGRGGRRPGRRQPGASRPPAPPVVHEPPIDLDTIAAAVSCSGELALAGLSRLRALTRSSEGPGPMVGARPELAEEIGRCNAFAAFLRPKISKRKHRDWLDHLTAGLSRPDQPCPF